MDLIGNEREMEGVRGRKALRENDANIALIHEILKKNEKDQIASPLKHIFTIIWWHCLCL